jgi:hypothetical protein
MDAQDVPRSHGRRPGCLLLVLVAAGSTAVLYAGAAIYESWGRPTVASVRGMLADSGIRPGSARQEVQAWLDGQGIYYKPDAEVDKTGGYPAAKTPAEVGGLGPGEVGGVAVARWAEAVVYPYNPWWRGEVWAYFFFDRGGRLIRYEVRAWPGYF